jgi:hypothetical protein
MLEQHDVKQELTLDVDGLFWYGETSDLSVNVPVGDFAKAVRLQYQAETRYGHVYTDTYVRCVRRVQRIEYWLESKYCIPRYVPDYKRSVRIDVLTRNVLDVAIIEHNLQYWHVIALDTDYAILRRNGTDYHEVVFHDRLNSSEVQRIERFLLSMHSFNGIESNLFVNFTLPYSSVMEDFNERYILVEQ